MNIIPAIQPDTPERMRAKFPGADDAELLMNLLADAEMQAFINSR